MLDTVCDFMAERLFGPNRLELLREELVGLAVGDESGERDAELDRLRVYPIWVPPGSAITSRIAGQTLLRDADDEPITDPVLRPMRWRPFPRVVSRTSSTKAKRAQGYR